MKGLAANKSKTIFFYLLLPVGLYLFMVVIPAIVSFYYSLFDWTGGQNKEFIWFANYADLMKDTTFWLSFKNSLIFTVFMVLGQVGIAFLLSLFFTMGWVKLKGFHRYVMFFPVVISPVVIGLMWQLIYNQDIGLLNFFLRNLGLEGIIKPWLDDPKIIMRTVSAPVIWQYVGFYLVILSSAVASIPKEIFESAEIDGATDFKRSIHITIPMIYDSLKICIMLCIIGSMKAFDHIMVLTNGGPGTASTVMALYGYNTAFITMRLSYSNTIAIGILVLTLIITLSSRALLGGKRYE